MKKIFAFLVVTTLLAGCQKDIVDTIPVATTLSAPLTLSFGESTTRSFDADLKWSWEQSDEIVGYQNSGDKTRNILTLQSGNEFASNNFTYSTEESADFHFFYAHEDPDTQALTAVQDGTWRPVLVGTATNTTLDAIETVSMEHLSAALEVRVWKGTREDHVAANVTAVTLSSNSDFVGKWTADDDLGYEQTLDGKKISLSGLNTSTVVFNMPVNEGFEANTLTLTLTRNGIESNHSLPKLTFVAGKRTIVNIVTRTMANLPIGSTIKEAIPDNTTVVRFVVNSDTTSETKLVDGTYPIYVVTKDSTEKEFHTPADIFMANADCSNMFASRNKLTSIVGLDNIDTSQVTNMRYMFYSCNALTSLDLSSFDTSQVTNMVSMFASCNALTSLDLSSFNTSQVINMETMFYSCNALTSLDLSGFDTSQVTNMRYMFASCEALTSLDLSRFKFDKDPNVETIFSGVGNKFEPSEKTQIIVSSAGKSYLEYNDLGNGNYVFVIKS